MAIAPTRKVSSTNTSESQKRVKSVYATGGESNDFVEAIDAANRTGVHSEFEYDRERKKKEQENFQNRREVLTSGVYVKSAIEALAASGVYEASEEDNATTQKNVNVYHNNQSMVSEEKPLPKKDTEDDEFSGFFSELKSELEEKKTPEDIIIEEINKLI